MPILDSSDILKGLTLKQSSSAREFNAAILEEEDITPDSDGLAGAHFRQNNLIGSLHTRHEFMPDLPLIGRRDPTDVNYEFDPFEYAQDVLGVETLPADLSGDLVDLNTEEEVHQMIAFKEKQRQDRDIINNAGTLENLAYGAAAGILDPTFFIPVFGAASKAGKLANMAVRSTAMGASIGGAVALQEVGLHATQTERTVEESAFAIGASAVLGASLGAASAFLTPTARMTAREAIKHPDTPLDLAPTSAGAAEVALRTTVEQFEEAATSAGLYGNKLQQLLIKMMQGPGFLKGHLLRAIDSPYATLKELATEAFDHQLIIRSDREGTVRSKSVQSYIKDAENDLLEVQRERNNQYKAYRQAEKAQGNTPLSSSQFDIEVDNALRNKDLHNVEQIAATARAIRSKIDNLTKEMQDLELLSKDLEVKTAGSWFRRVWNTEQLATSLGRSRFYNVYVPWFKRHTKDGKKRKKPVSAKVAKQDVDEVYNSIMGRGSRRVGMQGLSDNLRTTGTPWLNSRTFLTPDDLASEFLVKDPLGQTAAVLAKGRAMVGIKRLLRSKGHNSIADYKAEFSREASIRQESLIERINQLPEGGPRKALEKELRALVKAEKAGNKLIDDTFDLLLGEFGTRGRLDQGLALLRTMQVVTKLGGMLLSSLPDPMIAVIKAGPKAYIQDGIMPLTRNISKNGLSPDEYADVGLAVQHENNSILRAMTDTELDLHNLSRQGVLGKVQRGADVLLNAFSHLTGMNIYNNMGERIAAHMFGARMIRSLKKVQSGKALDNKEIDDLNRLGIGTSLEEGTMASRILEQFSKYGAEDSGSFTLQHHTWTDREAARKAAEAVRSQVNATIIRPDVGDIPAIFRETAIGKTIGQFKSFSAGVVPKVLIPAIQEADTAAAVGILGMVGMGMLSTQLKLLAAGKPMEDDFDVLLYEGITRSGTLGLFNEYIVGLNPYGRRASKYAGRYAENILLGPSLNTIGDAYQTITGATDLELSPSERRRLLRLLPFNNLFYFRKALEKLTGADQ